VLTREANRRHDMCYNYSNFESVTIICSYNNGYTESLILADRHLTTHESLTRLEYLMDLWKQSFMSILGSKTCQMDTTIAKHRLKELLESHVQEICTAI
jgi:hypothetical protein